MCKCIKAAWRWVCEYWERVLFALVGLACLGFSFRYLYYDNITSASATFVVAFFSFIYANLARFKKFKGMGFEAELWEDKQREAADLIERLKNVVSIYTREAVMSKVMRGRLGGGADWKGNWALYDELASQHDALGQKIDFSDLKRRMDGTFLFDVCVPLSQSMQSAIQNAKTKAQETINKAFGSPITDSAGYSERVKSLHSISYKMDDMYERAEHENIAQEILDKAKAASDSLRKNFAIEPKFDAEVIAKLEKVAALHNKRPIEITGELIALADRK